jgi:NTE family protein
MTEERKEGVGLALSGGGFRATLFHIGGLWRLNELGWLKKLTEVTSVSGGSIAATYLGLRWKDLSFNGDDVATNFDDVVVGPLREFCSRTVDAWSILAGLLTPFRLSSSYLARYYRRRLFDDATLQNLPSENEGPLFTIYATNLQTGVSFRLSKPYLADYRLGKVDEPGIELATAVAASSAFPPFLCPVILKFDPEDWGWFKETDKKTGKEIDKKPELFDEVNLRKKVYLGDGGIYDNLGLERVQDRLTTVLVSDAGAPFKDLKSPRKSKLLRLSLFFRLLRTLKITVEQTRSLRKRWLIGDYIHDEMDGTYWGIVSKVASYKLEENNLPGPIVKDSETTKELCTEKTRLKGFGSEKQEQLINWGYALADAAMRRHVLGKGAEPGELPYPERLVR